jgi:ATP-binding cassette subfamily B multidrug efflux pump
VLVGALDFWMMLPFLVWLGFYVCCCATSCPRCGDLGNAVECALDHDGPRRRQLHQHHDGEAVCPCGPRGKLCARGDGRLPADGSSADAFGDEAEHRARYLNSLLLFAVGAIGIWSWIAGSATVGAIAVAVGLVLRLEGMAHWVMWELAGLFENIGMAEDGMGMLSRPRAVQDKPGAKTLVPFPKGGSSSRTSASTTARKAASSRT